MGQLSNSIKDYTPSFDIAVALEQIQGDFGEEVYIKPKMLSKFGRNPDVGTTAETVMEHGGNETMLTTNGITRVVSANAGDTQSVRIEGHTISGNDLTFAVQTVTLNGTTPVNLPTPLARATRLTNESASSDFAGQISVQNAAGSINYLVATGVQANGRIYNRSQKAATSISANDYWIITSLMGAALKKQPANVDFALQRRATDGVWQELYAFGVTTGSPITPHTLTIPIIIPSNSDVRLTAVSDTAGTEVIGRISGYLALVA